MSFSLEGEQVGSSQESSSFWEFMATNSRRNEEDGGIYGGEGRASPDLLLVARGHKVDTRKQHYTYTETQTLHLPSGRNPIDTSGDSRFWVNFKAWDNGH